MGRDRTYTGDLLENPAGETQDYTHAVMPYSMCQSTACRCHPVLSNRSPAASFHTVVSKECQSPVPSNTILIDSLEPHGG